MWKRNPSGSSGSVKYGMSGPTNSGCLHLGNDEHHRDLALFDELLVVVAEEEPVVDGSILGSQNHQIVFARVGFGEHGELVRATIGGLADHHFGLDLGRLEDR